MNLVLAMIIISMFSFLGILIAMALGIKNWVETFGLSFILGSLWITTAVVLLQQYFGFAINAQLFFGLLTTSTVLILVALYLTKKFKIVKSSKTELTKKLQSLSKSERLMLSVIAILVAGSLIQNLFWPVTDWDALALYDFRARIVAETGSFSLGNELGYFFQYPPFTSLLHTSLYVLGFEQAKLWYTILYASFVAVFYALIRKRTSRFMSLTGALLLAANPYMVEHSIMAYTNLAYVLFFSLGIIYLWDWLSESSNSSLLLGGILVGGSTWVRMSEPFWIVGIVLISLGLFIKKKTVKNLAFGITAVALILVIKSIWPDFVADINTVVPPVLTEAASTPAVAPSLSILSLPLIAPVFGIFRNLSIFMLKPISELWSRAIGVYDYFKVYIMPVFSVFLIPSLIVAWYDLSKDKKQALIEWGTVVLLAGLIFLGTLIFSFSDSSWDQIGGSAQRMSLFLIPLILYPLITSSIWQKTIKKLSA